MRVRIHAYGLILVMAFTSIAISSCKNKPKFKLRSKKYLHISHTKSDSIEFINANATTIDYSKYDLLMLGGDMGYSSSENAPSLNRLDAVFDLDNPNTLWALGNHDYANLSLLTDYTQRPTYYAYAKNGITFVVLDSQDSLCYITGDQFVFLNEVLDTIENSSHLVLLHHKLIWMPNNETLSPQIASVSNGPLGDCHYCLNPNNFYADIYPRLVNIQNNGTKVLCIGGDLGFNSTTFSYQTPDGIEFLGSGISAENEENHAILFHHDVKNQVMTWEFKPIRKLKQVKD